MKRTRTYRTLKQWRAARDFTQIEAAQHLGISQATYSKLENKVQGTRRFTAKHIAQETGVPLEVVMGVA